MVEKIVKDYLQSSLGIPVRLEEDKLTNEYVLIEKTGSSKKDHISTATIAIQSYSCRYMVRHRSTSGLKKQWKK